MAYLQGDEIYFGRKLDLSPGGMESNVNKQYDALLAFILD